MSDLLSRVIHRASGAASRVEPLLASRYEPQAAMETHAGEAAEPAAVRRVEESQASAPVEATKAREVREEEVQEFWEPQPARDRRREEASPRHPALLPAAATVRQATAHEVERERVMKTAIPLAPVTPVEVPLSRDGMREIRVETSEQIRTDRHTEARILEKAPPPAAAPARIETAAPQALRSGDIEVTIGHIELRMAAAPRPAPQAQPRPRPAQSRLSLDDYLRRRNGGAR